MRVLLGIILVLGLISGCRPTAPVRLEQERYANDLSEAAFDGRLEDVERLAVSDEIIQLRDRRTGFTALTWAVVGDQSQVVTLLLARGADPDVPDKSGMSALFHAIRQNRKQIVQQLVAAGADVNVRAQDDYTPLMTAAAYGRTDLASVLLEAGARPELEDHSGRTASAYAREHGYSDTADLIEVWMKQ